MIEVLFAMALAAAFPPPASNSLNVEIGGLLSGPSRRYVDLDAGVLLAGHAPPGVRGDGVGISTASLPVSQTLPLSAQDVDALSALAQAVLQAGADGPPTCSLTVDRIVRLEVTSPGQAISATLYCPTPQATALVDAVFRLGQPQR